MHANMSSFAAVKLLETRRVLLVASNVPSFKFLPEIKLCPPPDARAPLRATSQDKEIEVIRNFGLPQRLVFLAGPFPPLPRRYVCLRRALLT